MVLKLATDPRVEASIRRLKAMGLEVEVYQPSNNEVLIKITGASVLNYLVRKMNKAITYPAKDIWYDFDSDAMFIYMWRGKPRKNVIGSHEISEDNKADVEVKEDERESDE
jgi:hypothetical protein